MAQGHLFIISAPTGAGKTTLANAVIKKLASTILLEKIVTYTTRPPRPRELPDIDYHFISPEAFTRKEHENFFLETNFYNNFWYGSPRSIVTDLAQGKSLILITDRNGAQGIKKLIPSAVLIWISVPDMDTLEERLSKRGSEHDEALAHRIALAQQEMEQEKHEPLFEAHIMNDNLTTALCELEQFIRARC